MSHIMAFLLTLFSPYRAFKLFCNLIITNKFLFRSVMSKQKHIWRINTMMEQIFARFYPETYAFLKNAKIEIWGELWMEWLYAMFLKSFHLKAALIFWDFFLLKQETWIFRLSFSAFGLIHENLKSMSRFNLSEECRCLILNMPDTVIEKSLDETKYASEFAYIDNLIGVIDKFACDEQF